MRRRADRPLVLAHRGASAVATENTLEAFAAAIAAGADGVELDVQLTADGELVVFHDADLRRMAGRPEPIERMTRRALGAVRLVGGERIPTLAEVLAAVPAPRLVNVELKSTRAGRFRVGPAAAAAIARAGAIDRVVVSSFDPLALAALRMAEPRLRIGLLFHEQLAVPLRRAWSAPALGVESLHPRYPLVTAERMAAWRRRHLRVAVWTVDDPAELHRLDRLGVDAVISNDPGAALAALRQASGLGPQASARR